MSACATQATPRDDPGQRAADPHRHRHVLDDLIGMGADLARLLHAQAAQQAVARPAHDAVVHGGTDAQPAPSPTSDTLIHVAAAFDRIARTIRRCVALARFLDQPVQPAPGPAQRRTAARKRIIREVEDRIGRLRDDGHDGPDSPATLQAELRERLDAPDLDDDLATRPVADIITEICRDLGLASQPGTHPWKRRSPADLQQLRTHAAAPSSPFRSSAGLEDLGRGTIQDPAGPLANPAGIPCPQPCPIPSDSCSLDHHASIVTTIPRHPTRIQGRWRAPPSS